MLLPHFARLRAVIPPPGQAGWVLIAQAKTEAGLDHYQLRSWRAWHAHITLSMLALAWLAATRAQAVKDDMHPAGPVAG